MRVHQGTPRVARIDGRIRLYELSWLSAVRDRWIGTVQSTDNAARNGEAEAKRIAERQDRLSWMQLCRIAPGSIR